MSQSAHSVPFPVTLTDASSENFSRYLRYLGSEASLRARCAGSSESELAIELQTRSVYQFLDHLGRAVDRSLLEALDEFCSTPEAWLKLGLAAVFYPGLPRSTAAADEEAASWLKFALTCYQHLRHEPGSHWPVPLATVPNLEKWPLKVPAAGGQHWLSDSTTYHTNPPETSLQVNAR